MAGWGQRDGALAFGRECLRAAASAAFVDWILAARADGRLARFLPEIDCMDRFLHDVRFHPEGAVVRADGSVARYGTVWDHTVAVLRDYGGADPLVNLGCLLHDIGKPMCAVHAKSPDYHNFPGHEAVGRRALPAVCARLGFPAALAEDLAWITGLHMTVWQFPRMRASRVLRIVRDPRWPALREVCLHDDRSRAGAFDADCWRECDRTVARLLGTPQRCDPRLVGGKLVMEVTGLAPGPELGVVQRGAEARMRADPALGAQAAVREAFAALRQGGGRRFPVG